MRVKFFAVPALDPGYVESEVNAFIAQHRTASIDRELVNTSQGVYWCLAITYLESTSASPAAKTGGREKIDYKLVLEPGDFQVFVELRRLRKALAERDGVPLYVLFSNKQLATMARERPLNPEALRGIEGVGDARIAKYGDAFLEKVSQFPALEVSSVPSEQTPEHDASHRDPS